MGAAMGAAMVVVAMVVAMVVATSAQLVIRAWWRMRRMRGRRGRDEGTGAMGGGVAVLSVETAVRRVGMRWCWTRRTFEGEGGRRWTSQAGKRTGEREKEKGEREKGIYIGAVPRVCVYLFVRLLVC